MLKKDLLKKCEELGLKKYKSKNKSQLMELIKSKSEKLRMVDLFSGTGIFSHVFSGAGKVNVVFANDILENSKAIYELNNSEKLFVGDINTIKDTDIPAHDILTAGFPCQPFSIAGLKQGFEDKRSNVFWKLLSIMEFHKPKVVILENVKNLQNHDSGKTFKTISENLERLGYFIKFKVLNTCKITNIPQNRERIYIVCFLDEGLCDKFEFDFPEAVISPISNFLEENVGDKYYYSDKSSIYPKLKESVVKPGVVYQYRRYYVRENKNLLCPTLTANMGQGGHNVPIILCEKGIRKLTPRECFNLQGFPRDYKLPDISDSGLYSLAGNAVSAPVIKLISEKILQLF